MNRFSQLDALCVASIVSHALVNWTFGGVMYSGTNGSVDSTRDLMAGGIVNDDETKLLVSTAQFDGENPKPGIGSTIEVYIDANGAPCAHDDSTSTRSMKVNAIGRVAGGLSYELGSNKR